MAVEVDGGDEVERKTIAEGYLLHLGGRQEVFMLFATHDHNIFTIPPYLLIFELPAYAILSAVLHFPQTLTAF
jgi:hypothetical protein